MYPQQIHGYLVQLFKENNCQLLTDNNHFITVQLSIEMDKKIMNRPFYWRYIESVNGEPNPAQLTLITDYSRHDARIKGEVMHIGSPRLDQLFQVTKEMGSFVKMYEQVPTTHGMNPTVKPWLGINYKTSYNSNQTKETLHSLGISLLTGTVLKDFQQSLKELELNENAEKHVFAVPFIITPVRGMDRLDAIVESIIEADDHTWAEEARSRWEKDRKVLDYFYEGHEVKPECYEIEKQAMEEQFNPTIHIEVVNGGLFYLA